MLKVKWILSPGTVYTEFIAENEDVVKEQLIAHLEKDWRTFGWEGDKIVVTTIGED